MTPGRRSSVLFVALLLASGLAVGLLVRPVAERFDQHPPQVGWGAASILFVLAVIIGVLAWNTWQSLHKRNERMTSDHAVKMLSLSKSCIIVGSLFCGGYAGYAIAFLGDLDTDLGRERAVHSAVAAGAALLLLIVALLLERACRLPEDHDDDASADANPA